MSHHHWHGGDPTNVGGGVSLCQNTQFRLRRKSPTPRPIRQFGRRRRRGRHCGRPPASLRTSPGGTVRFRFFVLHDHVMVVLRPCEAKLSGLRCLTIIGTEGIVITCTPASLRRAASTRLMWPARIVCTTTVLRDSSISRRYASPVFAQVGNFRLPLSQIVGIN